MKTRAGRKNFLSLLVIGIVLLITGCSKSSSTATSMPPLDRMQTIPANAIKINPSIDQTPPELHSAEYLEPVPLGSGVNTPGGEDSPFILLDANTIYFFFTPDVSIPAEKQLFDGVTGIWSSTKANGEWSEAQRVLLQNKNKLALDGAECIVGDEMWFASAREGNYRGVDIWTVMFKNGRWVDWKNAGKLLNIDYEVGELHVTLDDSEMYFHSARAGGKGDLDIWITRKVDGQWQSPENVSEVNSTGSDGWPCITPDGQELWFSRTYMGTPAVYRSKRINGRWGDPELIISQFAGEPSVDGQGNIYFVHHFYKDNRMIEADIYVAYRK